MAKTAWVVYNKDGAIKAKRVPEGKSAEGLSFFIRNTIGGTPIRAVQASDNATAKKLAMAAPGSTEEIAEPEDRSSADRAAELAALYDISFEDALDEIAERPQESQARIEGREPAWTDFVADKLTVLPRTLSAALPWGDESFEEQRGDLGLQSNPSLLPTLAMGAATWPMSVPASVLLTGATQIGTDALLDPEYNEMNAAVDIGATAPWLAIPGGAKAWQAIPASARQAAGKAVRYGVEGGGKLLESLVPPGILPPSIPKGVKYLYNKTKPKPAAQEQLDMFAPAPKATGGLKEDMARDFGELTEAGSKIMLPAARPLWEEDVRANYMPRTRDYQDFIKYPGQPNRKITPEEALILRGDLGFLDSLNLEGEE